MFFIKFPKLAPGGFFIFIGVLVLVYFSVLLLILDFEINENLYLKLNGTSIIVENDLESDDSTDLIDWHDYEFINYENTREGPGERSGYKLTDPKDIEENRNLFKEDGASMLVSNRISVNRSIQEVRSPNCHTKKYLNKLPSTSVIVIYYDEALSVLYRCLHSIYNRSPKELLHEIILMNDNSTREELYLPVEKYVKEKFKGKVKVFHNPTRLGLIVTRMEGARRASGDVILFLDSHMEVTTNWLPPLLHPIALNRKTATVPVIDSIIYDTFAYIAVVSNIDGGFDWNLRYHYFSLTANVYPTFGENHRLAVMTGGAYAINREYFFELGGYDEGMFLWNGENYELSLKLHLCGGDLIKVPCSRVGHLNRSFKKYGHYLNGINHSDRNLKRLVEVWFDEFKFLFYKNHPERSLIDHGDLSHAKFIQKELNCKPFKFYLDNIAPNILKYFPAEKQPEFASGAIRSKAHENLCIETFGVWNEKVFLKPCSTDLKNPLPKQDFIFTWHRNIIRNKTDDDNCFDGKTFRGCLYEPGPQRFQYLPKTQQILNLSSKYCLQGNPNDYTIEMSVCKEELNQKWEFGAMNLTALNNWEESGTKFFYN